MSNSSRHINNHHSTRIGSQACAACRHQRRKCAPNCLLAPYFPPDRQKDFLNAHKVFGVSNIVKTLKEVHPSARPIAAQSMIYEANVRASDPVGGCRRLISEMERRLNHVEVELDIVLRQLAIYHAPNEMQISNIGGCDDTMQNPNESIYDPACPNLCLSWIEYPPSAISSWPSQIQENQYHVSIDGTMQAFDGLKLNSETCSSSLQCNKQVFLDESQKVNPIVRIFDDRIQPVSSKSKPLIQSSDKVVPKDVADSIQPEQENDLKDAASLFTLTN